MTGDPASTPKLTDEQRALFIAVEDVLQQHHCCFEDLCAAYAMAFRVDAAHEEDQNVKGCLEQAAESLDNAGMDWYVSTK